MDYGSIFRMAPRPSNTFCSATWWQSQTFGILATSFVNDPSIRYRDGTCLAANGPVLGCVHTGSGSVPDSSEPNASGRLRVGFAFTLLTTDPTRTVRVRFAVYTLRLLRYRLWSNCIYHVFGSCVNCITCWSRANQGNIWKSLFCCNLADFSSCM